MPAVTLSDLATGAIQVYAPRLGIDPASVVLRTIGRRPGEKLREVLVTEEETAFACEDEHFYIILPLMDESELEARALDGTGCRRASPGVYDSSNAQMLSASEIAAILAEHEDSQRLMGNALHDIQVSRA